MLGQPLYLTCPVSVVPVRYRYVGQAMGVSEADAGVARPEDTRFPWMISNEEKGADITNKANRRKNDQEFSALKRNPSDIKPSDIKKIQKELDREKELRFEAERELRYVKYELKVSSADHLASPRKGFHDTAPP